MTMQLRDPGLRAGAGARPPSWRAKLVVALIVGTITAAATVFAIRYFMPCGNCAPPVERSARALEIGAGAA